MGDTPVFSSPALPRIAPPSLHTRTPSRSPTRNRLADDILSDLTPVTTLEAFKNPSGRLRASIEDATPSEQAFGLRAALASKNIQEWVDELSNWSWPAEGGSLGFEVPPAKRRRLSPSSDGIGREQNGIKEPEYVGSLLAQEVLRYEIRLDEITADMEELNVEEIKRQVLDTHFSAKSRPSSSASNSPMPGFLSSYTKMDDFTAIVTATVLQALPNLSKLMRLMDVWSIRLSVLRKVPPLLQALGDAEIALKSGWDTINNPGYQDGEDVALSRETFGIMRNVLQDKVTTLGQDLDYMLDTLEGREDTLPESWLDRMETIEQDYGEWVVAGDRKVRQGEWAKMAKARREAEEARRIKEAAAAKAAEEAETARRKVQQEAEEAAAAEAARLRAAREAEEVERARLKAIQDAEDARIAEIERQRAEKEVEEARAAEDLRLKAEQEAEDAERARKQALQEAEQARNAEIARQEAQRAADEAQIAETAKRKAEQEVEAEKARQQALQDVEDAHNDQLAKERAEKEADDARAEETARRKAEAAEMARLQALRDAEDVHIAEMARQKALNDAEEAEAAEVARRQAEKEAEELARHQAERDAEESARLKFLQDAEDAEQARRQAQQDAEDAESARRQAQKDAEDAETARLEAFRDSEQAAARSRQAQKELEDAKANEAAVLRATHDGQAETAKQQQVPSVKAPEPQTVQDTRDIGMSILPSEVALPALAVGAGVGLASTLLKQSSTSATTSKIPPFDGNDSEESEPTAHPVVATLGSRFNGVDLDIIKTLADDVAPERLALASPIHFDPPQQRSPSTTISPIADSEETGSPKSPRTPRFGHAFANLIRRASSPKLFSHEHPSSSDSTKRRKSLQISGILRPREAASVPQSPTESPLDHDFIMEANQGGSKDTEWIVVDSHEDFTPAEGIPPPSTQLPHPETHRNLAVDGTRSKRHNRNVSVVTGRPSGAPTPTIREAEAADYFRPLHLPSPTKPARSPVSTSGPAPPSKSHLALSEPASNGETVPILDGNETPTKSLAATKAVVGAQDQLSLVNEGRISKASEISTGGDDCEVCNDVAGETPLEKSALPVLANAPSTTGFKNEINEVLIPSPRPGSISSDTPTIVNGSGADAPSSPIASTMSPRLEAFPEVDESPTAGRVGLRHGNGYEYSPPESPPAPAISKRPSLNLQQSPQFGPSDPTGPLTPVEPPLFDEIDLSPAPMSSPKKASSDEQLQQQISNLLESIPARIRLTSEPDANPFSPNTLHPKKIRRSITPSFRSSSSMSNYSTSSRAPTPSFTLAPAFSKTNHRSRTPGNPEIKLYHLSRSTGEAPIKLFVRLVGEHGERVMVRVGGGWADLGEYLKEYASHHGRRTAADNDRVEIQDLPSRIVSNSSSISSSATVRGNGRDSPVPRPQSVLERPMERPGSSLNIRKTRKSVGESEYRANDIRSPSTPLPSMNRLSYETPPSAAGSEASSTSTGPSFRSSSRLSWTDEDSSLGLAGPKSKKVVISEKDQEWVESMKEKVRQASAEKERRNKDRESLKESQRRTSFGEMEKVGGTKRLFRKSGV
jgi:Growth-Arrest-Specific Protein 2 Domain